MDKVSFCFNTSTCMMYHCNVQTVCLRFTLILFTFSDKIGTRVFVSQCPRATHFPRPKKNQATLSEPQHNILILVSQRRDSSIWGLQSLNTLHQLTRKMSIVLQEDWTASRHQIQYFYLTEEKRALVNPLTFAPTFSGAYYFTRRTDRSDRSHRSRSR